jgi:hypothetical protein
MAPVADGLAIPLFVLDLGLIIWDELEAQKTTDNSSTSGTYGGENGSSSCSPARAVAALPAPEAGSTRRDHCARTVALSGAGTRIVSPNGAHHPDQGRSEDGAFMEPSANGS